MKHLGELAEKLVIWHTKKNIKNLKSLRQEENSG